MLRQYAIEQLRYAERQIVTLFYYMFGKKDIIPIHSTQTGQFRKVIAPLGDLDVDYQAVLSMKSKEIHLEIALEEIHE